MGLAWGIGYYKTLHLFLKYNVDDSPLLKLFAGVFLSGWIGAKIFFLIFSAPTKIQQYLYADYFWLGGGFVFYGGLIFGILFYLFFTMILKKFNLQKTYLLIPGLAFGHAIGRIGCLLTGCCYGAQCDLPWAMKLDGEFRHPVQLYEAFALLGLGFLSQKWIKNKKNNLNIVTNYLLAYSLIRFILEFFRGDELRGIYWLSLSTSQYISIGLFSVTLMVRFKKGIK